MADLLSDARIFAIEMHERFKHRRSNGEPYWHHPERVVATLARHGVAPEVQAAGWIHDVAEDCAADVHECEALLLQIETRFGATVASLTREVTNFFPRSATMEEKQQRLIEHAHQMSPGAKWIKLADRMDNISDMAGWSVEKRRRYAEATILLLSALLPLPNGAESLHERISRCADAAIHRD